MKKDETGKGRIMKKKGAISIIAILILIFVVLWGICNLSSVRKVIEAFIGVILPIAAGGCFAFILNIPLRILEGIWIKFFSSRKRALRRAVCTFLCVFILFGAIALVICLILPRILDTAKGIYEKIPDYIARLNGWYEGISELLLKASVELPNLNISSDSIIEMVKNIIFKNSQTIIGTSMGIVTTAFGAVVDTVIAFFIAIYILARKERLAAGAKKLLYGFFEERTAERAIALSRLTEKTFSSFVTGQLTEAFILGALCFVGMLIFRIPYAALVAVLVGVTALIPIFGAFIGTGIGAFLILLESPLKAAVFVAFILVLQQIEGNLIYPRVVGSQVGLPGLWVLIAVTVGSEFGIFGMLVSVPLMSLIYTVVCQLTEERIAEKGLSEQFPDDTPKRQMKKPRKRK